MRAPIPPRTRFDRHWLLNEATGCHDWTSTTAKGYGTFQASTITADGKVRAARWLYEQEVGPIPEGYEVDHTCRRPICVNVLHLEAVTQAENNRRARLTVCRAGLHDLTDDAACLWDDRGRRRGCLVCYRTRTRAAARVQYARQKASR